MPPVLKGVFLPSHPPQTIISSPVQIAVWLPRALGAAAVAMGFQLRLFGA